MAGWLAAAAMMWSYSIVMRLNLISKGDCYSVMNRLMNGLLISFGDEPPPPRRCSFSLPGWSSPSTFSYIFCAWIFPFSLSFIALLRRNSLKETVKTRFQTMIRPHSHYYYSSSHQFHPVGGRQMDGAIQISR